MKIGDPVYGLARRLRPELDKLRPAARVAPTGDLWGLVTVTPMAVLGLIGLISLTSLDQLRTHWLLMLITTLLIALLRRWNFFLVAAMGVGASTSYANANASFNSVARWAGVLILGPVALWAEVIIAALVYVRTLHPGMVRDEGLNQARNLVFNLFTNTALALAAIWVYQGLGGDIPVQPLHLGSALAFIVALGVLMALEITLLFLFYLGYVVLAMLPYAGWSTLSLVVRMIVITITMPYLAAPFAFLAASVYQLAGLPFYLLFFTGLLLVARMAHSLSKSSERSRQQSTQMQKLEALGRALIDAPPDGSQLSDLLGRYVNGMFVSENMAIWTDIAHPLVQRPPEWDGAELAPVDAWLRANPQPLAIMPGQPVPWEGGAKAKFPRAVTPVLDAESGQPVGGIYMDLRLLAYLWDANTHDTIMLALPTLAAQVSAALNRSRMDAQNLAHQRTQQELELARQIQKNFLPGEPPILPGWEIAASLEPARQVSGDFYDLIPLPSGKLGLLVADVADKGLGPALFMALSRTLIRTFALEHSDAPEEALRLANLRIIQDAGDNLFVTAFYGVLDPTSGSLKYCNAGHNPPLLFHSSPPCAMEALRNTGIPLAVMQDAAWTSGTTQLEPGDLLVLYTDGVTDAQDEQGGFFDESGLRSAVEPAIGKSAAAVHASLLDALRQFCGTAPQGDDMTLMILTRENPSRPTQSPK